MMDTITPAVGRIVSTNELMAPGVPLVEEGGTWLVINPDGRTNYVATNRTAAEDALLDKAREHGSDPASWELACWQAQDTYPPPDDDQIPWEEVKS